MPSTIRVIQTVARIHRLVRRLRDLATKAGVEGSTNSKSYAADELPPGDIIRRGLELGVQFGLTVSCYQATARERLRHWRLCGCERRIFGVPGVGPIPT